MVTKFSNQNHTHNLYRWPLQHAITSYSTAATIITRDLSSTKTSLATCFSVAHRKGIKDWGASLLFKVQLFTATTTLVCCIEFRTVVPKSSPQYSLRFLGTFVAATRVYTIEWDNNYARFYRIYSNKVAIPRLVAALEYKELCKATLEQ